MKHNSRFTLFALFAFAQFSQAAIFNCKSKQIPDAWKMYVTDESSARRPLRGTWIQTGKGAEVANVLALTTAFVNQNTRSYAFVDSTRTPEWNKIDVRKTCFMFRDHARLEFTKVTPTSMDGTLDLSPEILFHPKRDSGKNCTPPLAKIQLFSLTCQSE